jgi:hypothetical protein
MESGLMGAFLLPIFGIPNFCDVSQLPSATYKMSHLHTFSMQLDLVQDLPEALLANLVPGLFV